MKAERPLRVIFFKTDTDNEPVREWLKELPKEDCKIIGTDILTVQYAWPVGKPLVDNLGDGIWEVRSRLDNRIARTLFAVQDANGDFRPLFLQASCATYTEIVDSQLSAEQAA